MAADRRQRHGERKIAMSDARPSISALISDVDGTLVTGAKELTERTKKAVAALHRRGIGFAIVSARPPEGLRMFIEPLKLSGPIAGFNGGGFVRPDMTVIEEQLLDPGVARRTVEFLEGRGVDAWVFSRGRWFIRDPNGPNVGLEERTVQFPPTIVAEFGAALDTVNKLVGTSDDYDLLAKCEAEAQQMLGRDAAATRSQLYYLDVTHPDANKGAAVRTLARLMGLPPGEIAVIGDGKNDVAMFAESPFSIAMGNASADVQQKARFVTASNEDDGFAQAVERYLLAAGAENAA
jgi:Cof subfamily protein (haloacid dehalogenase superfamily)